MKTTEEFGKEVLSGNAKDGLTGTLQITPMGSKPVLLDIKFLKDGVLMIDFGKINVPAGGNLSLNGVVVNVTICQF